MFGRLKNLVELSKYKPEQLDEKVVLKIDVEDKPKGMATVVEDDPISLFQEEEND